MTNDDQTSPVPADSPAMQRRFLLRGGAVLAGAAGITAVGAALGSSTAHAADGAPIVAGQANTATNSTSLTIAAGDDPALVLTNADGAALQLTPVPNDWSGVLEPGSLVGTEIGPLVGVEYGNGSEIDYLVTGRDLDFVPIPITVPPERLLDTRTVNGRGGILAASSGTAIDSAGRLTAGSWIDVEVASADEGIEIGGAFLNAASVGSLANGYLTLYTPGDRPPVSSVNYQRGVSVANNALVGLAVVEGVYAVRIFTASTTHLLLDISGVIFSAADSAEADAGAAAKKARSTRRARQVKRADKLRKSLRSVG